MKVRCQISSVMVLDKCINCHACSMACKTLWTGAKGSEYMWWNNVESKPGAGFPAFWEDQQRYGGGWETKQRGLKLKSGNRLNILADIFHSPAQPSMEEYYEPWSYQHEGLVDIAEQVDQPVTLVSSDLSGARLERPKGPNFDDELSGSERLAGQDPNLRDLSSEELRQFDALGQLFFSLPRICNHCLNPACVAACPSGAIYKRGEDGITLVDQQRCRGWRQCVVACPYKKVYFNWARLKAEKCIYCYPLIERNEVPACFHSCTGRARFTGYLLFDADRMEEVAASPVQELVALQRSMILDPSEPAVASEAVRSGIASEVLEAATRSAVYRLVSEWKLAFPLHPEFRTLPATFYVPPLLPIHGQGSAARSEDQGEYHSDHASLVRYLACLLSGDNEAEIRGALRRLEAVRRFRRSSDLDPESLKEQVEVLADAGLAAADANEIWKLMATAPSGDRFVLAGADRLSRLPRNGIMGARRRVSGLGSDEEDPR